MFICLSPTDLKKDNLYCNIKTVTIGVFIVKTFLVAGDKFMDIVYLDML